MSASRGQYLKPGSLGPGFFSSTCHVAARIDIAEWGVSIAEAAYAAGVVARNYLDVLLGRAHLGGEHRPDRIEGRVGARHLAVLVEDLHELPEVRGLPMPARPLALLEDRVERSLGRREVGHGHELGPVEVGARRLCARRPDEQVALTELVGEVDQARRLFLGALREVGGAARDLGRRSDVDVPTEVGDPLWAAAT